MSKLLTARTALQKSTVHQRWKRDNPGESARAESYWEKGDVLPSMITSYGLGYVLIADKYWDDELPLPGTPI